MKNGFIEPFLEALSDKTGDFGVYIASFGPVILVALLLVVAIFSISVYKSRKERNLIKILEIAKNHEVDCHYDEAWKLFLKCSALPQKKMAGASPREIATRFFGLKKPLPWAMLEQNLIF